MKLIKSERTSQANLNWTNIETLNDGLKPMINSDKYRLSNPLKQEDPST